MNFDILYEPKCVYKIQQKDLSGLISYFKKKNGWIYLAKSKDSVHFKIGRTGKNPLERAKTLSSAGVLNDYEIFFALKVFNQFWAEKSIHEKLKSFRVNQSKEFFSVDQEMAINAFHATIKEESSLLNRFFNSDLIKDDVELLFHIELKPTK